MRSLTFMFILMTSLIVFGIIIFTPIHTFGNLAEEHNKYMEKNLAITIDSVLAAPEKVSVDYSFPIRQQINFEDVEQIEYTPSINNFDKPNMRGGNVRVYFTSGQGYGVVKIDSDDVMYNFGEYNHKDNGNGFVTYRYKKSVAFEISKQMKADKSEVGIYFEEK
jgi:hypothetical protein